MVESEPDKEIKYFKEQNQWEYIKNQINILESLAEVGGLGFTKLLEKVDVSKTTLSKHLDSPLVPRGFVKKEDKRYKVTEEGAKELARLKDMVKIGSTSSKDIIPFHSKNQLSGETIETTGSIIPTTTSGGKIEIENPEQLVEEDNGDLNISIPGDAIEVSDSGTLVISWKGKKEKE